MQTIPAFGQVAVLARRRLARAARPHHLGTFLAFSTYMLLITPPIRQLAAILTVGQLARAGAERIYDLLDSTPLVQDARTRADLHVTTRRGALRPRDVRLHVDRAGAARLRPHGRAGRDRRARRQLGLGQVDGRPDAAPLLRRARGRGHDRRRRRARRYARVAAAATSAWCSRTRSCSPTRSRPTSRSAGPTRPRPRSRPRRAPPKRTSSSCASRRLRHRRRRARAHALGRAAAADRARARVALRPEILLLDDATSSVDSRVEEEIHATLRRIAQHAHDDPDRAPALVALARRPHRRGRQGRGARRGHARRAVGALLALPHAALGPGRRRGGRRRGRGARSTTTTQVDGITPAAWRGLDDEELRDAQIADRTRAASPRGRAIRRPGGGGGGGGWMGGMGGALAPTPELLAQVDALPPATPIRTSTSRSRARPASDFKFLRFLQPLPRLARSSACCSSRSTRRARSPARCSSATASTTASPSDVPRALWAASAVFLVITLFDWWVMWAEARVMGRMSERMLHALRIKVFAHLQRLGVDYYEHEMAGRIMTRMTTDIDALSQLLQNGLVNALVNLVTFVGVGIALVFIDPQLALITARHPAAADHRDDLVPFRVEQGVRVGARAHRRGQRQPARRAVGRARLAGVRARGTQPGGVRRGRGRLPRRAGRAPSGSSRSTSRSSTSSPTSRCVSCSARAACSSRTARSRSAR